MKKSDKIQEWSSTIKEDGDSYYDNAYLPW